MVGIYATQSNNKIYYLSITICSDFLVIHQLYSMFQTNNDEKDYKRNMLRSFLLYCIAIVILQSIYSKTEN